MSVFVEGNVNHIAQTHNFTQMQGREKEYVAFSLRMKIYIIITVYCVLMLMPSTNNNKFRETCLAFESVNELWLKIN